MITCNECRFIKFDDYNMRYSCYCDENVLEKFSPISGEYYTIKNDKFHNEANKHGDCLWFEPKKQKWWKKKKVFNKERYVNENTGEFLTFMRENYPDIVIEYMMTPKEKDEEKVSRVKPTPNPTAGMRRT